MRRPLVRRAVAPPQGAVVIPISRYGLSRSSRRLHKWRPRRRVLRTIRQCSLFLSSSPASGISDCGHVLLYSRIHRGDVQRVRLGMDSVYSGDRSDVLLEVSPLHAAANAWDNCFSDRLLTSRASVATIPGDLVHRSRLSMRPPNLQTLTERNSFVFRHQPAGTQGPLRGPNIWPAQRAPRVHRL